MFLLLQNSMKEIEKILKNKNLPQIDFFSTLIQEFIAVLKTESIEYRALDEKGKPGSLLDFQNDEVPVLIVPDLHARPLFLYNILCLKIEGKSVFSLLQEKKIRIICVGDALHSEHITRVRWSEAEMEMEYGDFDGPSMTAEMVDGLNLVCAIMKLKVMFPEYFHFLKGNHENILNSTGNGDYSFRKYVNEGQMVKRFVEKKYGNQLLCILHDAEMVLPLIAVGKNFVVSHAEPKIAYTKNMLINARNYDKVIEDLTWTDNDEAQENSVQMIINELVQNGECSNYVYFGGHRPVHGDYNTRQNGTYIQLHNPTRQNVAYVTCERKFDPKKDLINVEQENKK